MRYPKLKPLIIFKVLDTTSRGVCLSELITPYMLQNYSFSVEIPVSSLVGSYQRKMQKVLGYPLSNCDKNLINKNERGNHNGRNQ